MVGVAAAGDKENLIPLDSISRIPGSARSAFPSSGHGIEVELLNFHRINRQSATDTETFVELEVAPESSAAARPGQTRLELPPSPMNDGLEPQDQGITDHAMGSHGGQYYQDLYIVIVRGEPKDVSYARNVDIRIEYNGDPGANWTMRVRGTAPAMHADTFWGQSSAKSTPKFLRMLHVTTLQTSAADDPTLRQAIASTPLNGEIGDTSQHWVDAVMTNLEIHNLIDPEDARWAIDQMTGVIVEAPEG